MSSATIVAKPAKYFDTLFEWNDSVSDAEVTGQKQFEDLYTDIGRLTTTSISEKRVAFLSHAAHRKLVLRESSAFVLTFRMDCFRSVGAASPISSCPVA